MIFRFCTPETSMLTQNINNHQRLLAKAGETLIMHSETCPVLPFAERPPRVEEAFILMVSKEI